MHYRVVIELIENLPACLKNDPKRGIYLFSPIAVSITLFFAFTSLPSYSSQKGIVLLLVNYAIGHQTLNMMLHNMTKKSYSFSPLQPALLLIATPLLAYHIGGVSEETEKLITLAMTAMAFFWFLAKMTILSF